MNLNYYILSGDNKVFESDSQQVCVDLSKHFVFSDDTVDVSITDLYKAGLKLKTLHGYHLFDGMMDELSPFLEWTENLYTQHVVASYRSDEKSPRTTMTDKVYRLVVVEDWEEGIDYNVVT